MNQVFSSIFFKPPPPNPSPTPSKCRARCDFTSVALSRPVITLGAPELNHVFHADLSVAPEQLQPHLVTLYESGIETLKDCSTIFV